MMGEEYLGIFSRLLVDLTENDKIKKSNENKKDMLDTSNNKDIKNQNVKLINDNVVELNDFKNTGDDENYSLSIIVFYNIIIELRKYLLIRYEMLKAYKFNISKMFRKYEKYEYMKNIEKCFPKYDEKKFNSEIKKLMVTKSDYKNIKGKLSQTWLFNEKKMEPELIEKDYIENDEFDKDSFKAEGKNLDLIIQYLEHYQYMEPKIAPKPFPSRVNWQFLRKILNDQWTLNYLQSLSIEQCIELINDASYLQIKGLIDILSSKIAYEMCNCTVEEAKKKI